MMIYYTLLLILLILLILLFILYFHTKRQKDSIVNKEISNIGNNQKLLEDNIKFNLYNQVSYVYDVLQCKFSNEHENYNYEIPVFILNRDRLYAIEIMLNKLFILQRSNEIKIYVLDHYSTYQPTVNYINKLADSKKITLIKLKKHNWYDMIYKELPVLIQEITAKNKNKYYVLTDADICIDYIPDDMIYFLIYILDSCRGIDVIGPHISVSTINNNYPKKEWAFKWETNYASKVHYDIFWKNQFFSIVASPIDTTFQVRRSDARFVRLGGKTFRSLPPYTILHTDYYIDVKNIPKSYLYYVNKTKDVDINHSYWN